MNPLEPPPGIRCEVHRSAVMASLKMALPLFPPLPQILDKALTRTYDKAGWDDDTTLADGMDAPTFATCSATSASFESIGYRGEAENLGRAFEARLDGLLQGSRGKLLDTLHSSDFAALLSKPTVVEMNDIVDADEKAVLAAFLLDRVRAGAKRRGSTGGELKHVTVIEEAHRLLAKSNARSGDPESGDRQRSDSVRAFCEAIAELRSLGEGFILSSQSPSALADAAIANTGTRILHRMESAVDRTLMLDDVDAGETVRQVAARLRKGEAVVRWAERDEVELVQVEPDDGIDSGRPVADDTVADHMQGTTSPGHAPAALPALQQRHLHEWLPGENPALGSEQRPKSFGARARELWTGSHAGEPIANLLAEESDDDLQLAYCTAVHLSINGDAFRPKAGRDDRPKLDSVYRTGRS